MVYTNASTGENSHLRLDIGNSAVWDDRAPGMPYSFSPDNFACNRPRLPIGSFSLDNFFFAEDSFQMRLG